MESPISSISNSLTPTHIRVFFTFPAVNHVPLNLEQSSLEFRTTVTQYFRPSIASEHLTVDAFFPRVLAIYVESMNMGLIRVTQHHQRKNVCRYQYSGMVTSTANDQFTSQ